MELVDHILEYTIDCKKEQNCMINKELFKKFKEKQKKCSYKKLWDHNYCRKCDKKEIDFIKYLKFKVLFEPK